MQSLVEKDETIVSINGKYIIIYPDDNRQHETSVQCRFKVAPPSATLAER